MAGNQDVVIRVIAQVEQAKAKLREATKSVQKGATAQSGAYNEVAKAQLEVIRSTNKMQRKLGKTPFAGYAMSIMFFGMAMQRVFSSVGKKGIKTFQDVMHSVDGGVTSFDMLSSSTAYLGFTIGQALEPVIAWLVPIIDAIAQWSSENPKLVASIVSIGYVLGTLFLVGGAGKLALNGFRDLSNVLSGMKLGSALSGISLSSPWVIAIIAVAAAAGALAYALFQNEEATDAAKKSWKNMDGPINDLKKTFLDMINTIFNSNLELEDMAWVAAWVFDIFAKTAQVSIGKLQIIIDAVTALIKALEALGRALMALNWARIGQFDKAKEMFDKSKEAAEDAWRNLKEAISGFGGQGSNITAAFSTLLAGPEAYRNANTTMETSNFFGDINVMPREGETAADTINRVLQERGVTG